MSVYVIQLHSPFPADSRKTVAWHPSSRKTVWVHISSERPWGLCGPAKFDQSHEMRDVIRFASFQVHWPWNPNLQRNWWAISS